MSPAVLTGLAPPFRGGIAHYTLHLAAALARIADVRLVAWRRQYPGFLFPGRTQIDESPMRLAVPAIRILDPANPVSWIEAAGAIRDAGATRLVHQWWHPWFGPATWALLRLVRARGVHVTVLAHNVEPHERIPGALLAARAALAPADRIVVHGSASARAARRLLPRAEVVAHPHPPYLSLFPSPACGRGEARARLGIDPAARVVLHFGCVKPYKGLHDLIEAMPGVVREAPDARLIVAGEFYDPVERYAEKARSLGVDAAVRLLDRYVPNAEVGLHLRAADVVALPYREATGSGVLPLALAAGVPIVATSVGDIPDAMVDGRDGALVPPRDPPALAAAILSILSGRSPRPHTPGSAASWDSLARVCLGNG